MNNAGNNPGGNPGLAGVVNQLGNGARAFIMTPQAEGQPAQNQGAGNGDTTVTYVNGLLYDNLIRQSLVPLVQQLIPNSNPTIYSYQAINAATDQAQDASGTVVGPNLLFSTARGHALFQYGGENAQAGRDKARLFFEGGNTVSEVINGVQVNQQVQNGIVWSLQWAAAPADKRSQEIARREMLPCGNKTYLEDQVRRNPYSRNL